MCGAARDEYIGTRARFVAFFADVEGEDSVEHVEGFFHVSVQMRDGPDTLATFEIGERETPGGHVFAADQHSHLHYAELDDSALIGQDRVGLSRDDHCGTPLVDVADSVS